jgi:hypothetical protein
VLRGQAAGRGWRYRRSPPARRAHR